METSASTSPGTAVTLGYCETVPHLQLANAIRALSMDAVQKAKSGHPGMPMGMADVATVLFGQFLKFDPTRPDWPDRDRFVLSAGHGSMLLYSLTHLTGYAGMTMDQLKNFRQLGSRTPGHPEVDTSVGAEMTTGPLGQGIATAVGLALAERIVNRRLGDGLVDHYTYVIASDGDLMEGVSHEACSLAGHLSLGKLIVLYDDNGISIDGPTDLSFTDDTQARFRSYGWHVLAVDGHDPQAVANAIAEAQQSEAPSLIACRTTIGWGAPNKAGTSGAHGSPLGDDEIAGTRERIGWPHAPFELPDDVVDAWRAIGRRGHDEAAAWETRFADAGDEAQSALSKVSEADLPDAVVSLLSSLRATQTTLIHNPRPLDLEASVLAALDEMNKLKAEFSADAPTLATRQASGKVLERLVPAMPDLMGGSADLTPSNNTKVKNFAPVTKDNGYDGRYVHFGVREHGMAAIMNGMALHGGVVPYGGTFLQFTDYCRPSIRLSAIMRQRVIYVMTHDSIGLGEDGPTHQPVEHISALRAMPNLYVFRPGDAVETAETWAAALASIESPSVIALTRQGLPTLRTTHTDENLVAKGGYVLRPAQGAEKVSIIASGSELAIACEAQEKLHEKGIGARVVSLPCRELFERLSVSDQDDILGHDILRVGVEAAIGHGWGDLLGRDGIFVGMSTFGESAPYKALYEHFGITADHVVDRVLARLG